MSRATVRHRHAQRPRRLAGALLLAFSLALGAPTAASSRPIVEHTPTTPKKPPAPPAKEPVKEPEKETKTETKTTAASKSSEEASESSPPSRGEPFGSNGGASPLCGDPSKLSAQVQRNCETSDFIATSAPTGNYAFDVNINTGIANLSNDISATIENFLQFGWMGLVALVHGLIVLFEWCYSLNLLEALMGEITSGLHQTLKTFTQPWMVVALAIASVLAVYHGLVRRRVAETVGQVMLMLAMMTGGLWVIINPAGSIGALGKLANESSLGTLSAVTTGNPNNATRNLANTMQEVFKGVITVPWCYMEFGNVAWCREHSSLETDLQKAGQKIAETEQKESKCSGLCGAGADARDRGLAASAYLLKHAETNGELFLALPANEVDRNSVKTEGSLLAVLCGSEESADECNHSTPSAPEAEFRTERGTGARVIGLILIWLGALGMLLLLGFLVFRLLEAAIAALLYLLLAPAAVLAPALGDGGRAAFRGWATRLLGAVISKLIYSFFLGVVLMMMNLLLHLNGLGWWAQWLLISALWWVALHHRHKVLGFAHGSNQQFETSSMRWFYRVRMAQDLGRFAGWARHKLTPPPPETQRRRPSPLPGGGRGGPTQRPSGDDPQGTGGSGGDPGGSPAGGAKTTKENKENQKHNQEREREGTKRQENDEHEQSRTTEEEREGSEHQTPERREQEHSDPEERQQPERPTVAEPQPATAEAHSGERHPPQHTEDEPGIGDNLPNLDELPKAKNRKASGSKAEEDKQATEKEPPQRRSRTAAAKPPADKPDGAQAASPAPRARPAQPPSTPAPTTGAGEHHKSGASGSRSGSSRRTPAGGGSGASEHNFDPAAMSRHLREHRAAKNRGAGSGESEQDRLARQMGSKEMTRSSPRVGRPPRNSEK